MQVKQKFLKPKNMNGFKLKHLKINNLNFKTFHIKNFQILSAKIATFFKIWILKKWTLKILSLDISQFFDEAIKRDFYMNLINPILSPIGGRCQKSLWADNAESGKWKNLTFKHWSHTLIWKHSKLKNFKFQV